METTWTSLCPAATANSEPNEPLACIDEIQGLGTFWSLTTHEQRRLALARRSMVLSAGSCSTGNHARWRSEQQLKTTIARRRVTGGLRGSQYLSVNRSEVRRLIGQRFSQSKAVELSNDDRAQLVSYNVECAERLARFGY